VLPSQNSGTARALSIRQPYALLICLGLKPVEFRKSAIQLKAGDTVWVISAQITMQWADIVRIMALQHLQMERIQSMIRVAFDEPSLQLNARTFQHVFRTGAVVGRVRVACKKASVLSFYHSLNPDPRQWDAALELEDACFVHATVVWSVSGAFPFPFTLRWQDCQFVAKRQHQQLCVADAAAMACVEECLFSFQ
jgi:hypothetical protein